MMAPPKTLLATNLCTHHQHCKPPRGIVQVPTVSGNMVHEAKVCRADAEFASAYKTDLGVAAYTHGHSTLWPNQSTRCG